MPQEVYGDEERLKQVGINLITNAINKTYSGNITLDIKFDHQN